MTNFTKLIVVSRISGIVADHLCDGDPAINDLLDAVKNIVGSSNDSNKEVTPQELYIFTTEGKIPAIQAYRSRTGEFLKESKEAIEKATGLLRLQTPSYPHH